MSCCHRFLPEFFVDVTAAKNWYEQQQSSVGDRFIKSVTVTVERVVLSPLSNALVDPHTRVAIVTDFPYGVYFRMAGEEVVIIGLWDLRRRPGLWRQRR